MHYHYCPIRRTNCTTTALFKRNYESFGNSAAFSLFAFTSLISLSGCGGGSSTPPPPPALEITSAALPAGTMNSAYGGGSGFSLAASGGVAPYKWSWAAAAGSTLPPGLSLSNGLISGSPTTQGPYNVVVTVSDSQSPVAHTSMPYSVTINDQKQALAITSGTPTGGTVGTRYHYGPISCLRFSPGCYCTPTDRGEVCQHIYLGFTSAATGGVSPYIWSWTAGPGSSLPPGLSMSSGGLVSGTPTKDGSFMVVVAVTDSASPAAQTSANYTLVIAPPPPPVITSTTAPAFTLGVLYSGFPFIATGGTPPYTWSETGTLPNGMAFSNTAGVLSGTPTATGPFLITVTLVDSAGQSAVPKDFRIQVFPKGFSPSAIMSTGRVWHTATLLENGKVLVTGGVSDKTFPTVAELFDPPTASFAPVGSMEAVRVSATATLLNNGLVLVAGGKKTDGSPMSTAELFDPNTKSFKPTGSMETERVYHASTLLSGGKVLVTGGLNLNGGLSGIPVATAEEFDPTTGIFSPTDNLGLPRFFHTSTLLGNGKVLIIGGLEADGSATATAELFDPSSRTFTAIANMSAPRAGHTATLLNNGQVLITGGAAAIRRKCLRKCRAIRSGYQHLYTGWKHGNCTLPSHFDIVDRRKGARGWR